MNLRQRKFVPLARHAFDLQSIRRTQQAVNALLNNRMVQGSGNGQIHNSDSNTVIELPALTQYGSPFQIYQQKNDTATAIQKALFTSANLNIDNLTFQIRGGLVGFRSYINTPSVSTSWPIGVPVANWELILETLNTDTTEDFFSEIETNPGTCIVLDDINPTLICGIPDGSPLHTDPIFNAQVVLNQNPTEGITISEPNARDACFWLEIVDDPNNGIYVNLWGCMYSPEVTSTRQNWPIPTGPNIVVLGAVRTYYPGDAASDAYTSVFQIQVGNAVNRFQPNGTTLRGKWNELFAALPMGVTKLWFYPGDQVIDDSAPIVWNLLNTYGIFQFKATTPAGFLVGQAPQGNADFTQVGFYPD